MEQFSGMCLLNLGNSNSPPHRGGVAAPKAQTGWSLTNHVDSSVTTPALRATPPVSGGELLFSFFLVGFLLFEFQAAPAVPACNAGVRPPGRGDLLADFFGRQVVQLIQVADGGANTEVIMWKYVRAAE